MIRWTEIGWHKGRRKNSRAVKIGTRSVTAQVEKVERSGFVTLLVLACTVEGGEYAAEPSLYRKGMTIRRKRATIARGGAERLAQVEPPEKPSRPKVASRFLS